MKIKYPCFIALFLLISCQITDQETNQKQANLTDWKVVSSIDVDEFNKDLENGKLTVDIGVYFPSNFDPDFHKVTLERMLESIAMAKEIYAPTGVQINLLWVKTGDVDPKYFAIQANEVPGIPDTEYVNLYQQSKRHPSILTKHAEEAFRSIIEPAADNDKTIYLIALEDVFFPFLTVSEGRNWTMKTVRTGGLSFPTYSYVDGIPREMRGVITITNLDRPDRYRRTVAHELGHKLMNVSHEYKETHPGFEVYADGGLMLYGNGEEIPSGKEGRYHLERLLLSPFLYKVNANGEKIWNEDYKEGGHYYDPLYKDFVIHFKPQPVIDEDW